MGTTVSLGLVFFRILLDRCHSHDDDNSHINSFSCTAVIDIKPNHPEKNFLVHVFPFIDALHDGGKKAHDGYEIVIRGGIDPEDFKCKKYKGFLVEEHGNEVLLQLPMFESSQLNRGDEFYKMDVKQQPACTRLEMARRTHLCKIADDPSCQSLLVMLRFPDKRDKDGKMVPEELTNERHSPCKNGQIKPWLTAIKVDYTKDNTGGVEATNQLKFRLAFKVAVCGERGVQRKASTVDADDEELAKLVDGMDFY